MSHTQLLHRLYASAFFQYKLHAQIGAQAGRELMLRRLQMNTTALGGQRHAPRLVGPQARARDTLTTGQANLHAFYNFPAVIDHADAWRVPERQIGPHPQRQHAENKGQW